MIGKYQLEISGEKLAMGMATSKYLQDGGLAPDAHTINPFARPGAIGSTSGVTDRSTNATGKMIASAEDSQSTASFNRVLVDDEGGYYTASSTGVLTKQETGAQTSKYTQGFTDMVSFALNTYVTLTDDIAQLNTSGAITLDEDWWTATKSQAALNTGTPHPMIVFEGFLWIADLNKLHKVTSGGTVTNGFLTLNDGERIQSLGIDPGSGLMLISIQTTQNYSDTMPSKNFILLFDGYSSKPRRKIPVDDLVSAFYNVGGTVFVGYGTNVGYFNGSGVSFLRRLRNVGFVGGELPYKHKFANFNQILLVIDGKDLLAYGEVLPGKKAWFNVFQNPASSNKFGCVAHLGAGVIGVSFDTDKFYVFDLTSVAAGIGSLITTNVNFPRPVFIRSVVAITDGVTTTSGVGSIAIIDERDVVVQPPGVLGQFVVLAAQSPWAWFNKLFTSYKVWSCRVRANFDTQGFAIVRIIIFYDLAE